LSKGFLQRVEQAEARDSFRLNSPRSSTASDRTTDRPPRKSLADLP
jgi:hypothetical protein